MVDRGKEDTEAVRDHCIEQAFCLEEWSVESEREVLVGDCPEVEVFDAKQSVAVLIVEFEVGYIKAEMRRVFRYV